MSVLGALADRFRSRSTGRGPTLVQEPAPCVVSQLELVSLSTAHDSTKFEFNLPASEEALEVTLSLHTIAALQRTRFFEIASGGSCVVQELHGLLPGTSYIVRVAVARKNSKLLVASGALQLQTTHGHNRVVPAPAAAGGGSEVEPPEVSSQNLGSDAGFRSVHSVIDASTASGYGSQVHTDASTAVPRPSLRTEFFDWEPDSRSIFIDDLKCASNSIYFTCAIPQCGPGAFDVTFVMRNVDRGTVCERVVARAVASGDNIVQEIRGLPSAQRFHFSVIAVRQPGGKVVADAEFETETMLGDMDHAVLGMP